MGWSAWTTGGGDVDPVEHVSTPPARDAPTGVVGGVVRAPAGYAGLATAAVTLGDGLRPDLTLRRNVADVTAGAKVVGFVGRDETSLGCGPEKAVDGQVGTGVDTGRPGPDDPATPDDEAAPPAQLTVRLSQPVDGARVWIDPTAHC